MDNLHNYSIEIRFDPKTARLDEKKTYESFLEKYNASASTVDEKGILSLFISQDKSLERKELEDELRSIEVVSFEKINLG